MKTLSRTVDINVALKSIIFSFVLALYSGYANTAVPVAADVMFVVDESGSMSGEHRWLREIIPVLEQNLLANGIGDVQNNLYGLVGFGNRRVVPRSFLVGAESLGSATELVQATNRLQINGGTEDGWRAVDFVLNEYTHRNGTAINIILVTDEDRDNTNNSITFDSVLTKLTDNRALLNSVLNVRLQCADGTRALGMDSNGNGYVADGQGGYTLCDNAVAVSGSGNTIRHYVDLTIARGGAVWDLNILRQGGAPAESFTQALVDIKAEEILNQRPVGDLVAVAEATPNPAVAGQQITLDGTASFHQLVDRSIVSWQWDLDNDGTFDVSGPVITTSFDSLGEYSVTLRVVDDSNVPLTDETTVIVNINLPPLPPTADSGGPYSFCPQNQPWFLDAGNSVNPDDGLSETNQPGDQIISYLWDLDNDRQYDDASGSLINATATLEPLGVGDHLIRLRVTDNTAQSFPSSGQGDLSDVQVTQVQIRDASDALCNCLTDLAARSKSTKIQLTWTDSSAHQYAVSRSLVKGGPYERIAVTDNRYSTYLNVGLELDQTYYYVVSELAGNGREICRSREVASTTSARAITRNTTPTIISQPIIAATERQLYVYIVEATDPDRRDTSTYSLEIAPSGMTIDAATGVINWVPVNAQVGQQAVVLRAVDRFGAYDEQVFTISVANINQAPRINSTPVFEAIELQNYQYQVQAIDPDLNDVIRYELEVSPIGMQIDGATGLITWIPQIGQAGNQNVIARVADLSGLQDSQSFTINVSEQNITPTITSTPVTAVELGDEYRYAVIATDPNSNEILTYSVVMAPDSNAMTIDPLTGVITWFPVNADIGIYEVTVMVTDSRNASVIQTFNLNVLEKVPPLVIVPGIVGQVQPAAEAALTGASLTVGTVTTQSSDTVPSGTVISQSPAAGASVTAGSAVDLVVSSGVALVIVPGVVSQVQSAAEAALTGAGLTVGAVTTQSSDTVLSGTVISQNPISGASVTVGSAVNLVVSSGPAPVIVPGVVSQVQAAAEAALTGASLTVGAVTTQPSDTVPSGTVISQHPISGASVTVGSAVDLVVSSGVAPVIVPGFVGQVQAAAEAAVTGAGLTVGTVTTQPSDTVPSGMVISQNPISGASVTAGSVVDLVVSSGVAPVIVPSVVSQVQAAAEAAVTGAGLTVGTVTTQPSDTVPSGTVISQNPISGASVTAGSAVDLVVSSGVAPVIVPGVVGQVQAAAEAALTGAGLTVGTVSTQSSDTVPSGTVISQNPISGASVTTGSAVNLVVSSGSATTALPLDVFVSVTPRIINVGESTTVTVSSVGGTGGVSLELIVDGTPVLLNTSNQATLSGTAIGSYQLLATASDSQETVDQRSYFSVQDPADTTVPTAVISTPVTSTEVTTPIEVIGTANDANLAQYQLLVSSAGLNQYREIAYGMAPVVDGVLGTFDPTQLENGIYDVGLIVTDVNGSQSTAIVQYQVTGDVKVGNFSFTVEDLSIPLAGIPITVSRIYDTRKKYESLDFGYGWSVDYQNIKIDESRVPGTGWQLNSYPTGPLGILTRYCVEPQGTPLVTVTLPNGDVERFEAGASPMCNDVIPLLDVALVFSPVGNTQSTLDALNDTRARLNGGQLLESGSFSGPVNPSRYRLTTRNGYQYLLNQAFGIDQIIDPNGNTLTYSDSGIVHSSGKSVIFTRDGQNRITRITDPNGNNIDYTYNVNGDLESVTDQLSQITQHRYNRSHGLIDMIDPLGRRVLRNIYDDEGRLIAQEDSDGNRTDFNHDIAGRTSTITDRLGRVTIYGYDDRGNVTTQIDAQGNTTTYTFDADDNQLTQTDPLGNVTRATFNSSRDQLTQIDALGNTVAFTYNTRGQELTIQDARGNTFTNNYDSFGNLLSIENPQSDIAGQNIDVNGNVSLRRDVLGNETTFTYDTEGNTLTETDALGNTISMTYDTNNNVLTETGSRIVAGIPVTETTSYVYDAQNRVIETTDALGNVMFTEYDAVGNETARIDALGNRTEFIYDAYRRLLQTTYADGTVESNTYDVQGNKLSSIDRLGRTTAFDYDNLDRQIRTTYADGSFTQTEYDAASRVIAEIDNNGNRSEFVYDAAGRRILNRDALGNETSFGYDADGNQLSQTDANGNTLTYVYDTLDRRIRTTYADTSFMLEGYDALGRVISKTDQAGITTNYEYDALGRLIAVIDALNQRTEYTYDEVGNKLTQRDANGNTTSWIYDALGRVLSRTLPAGQSESFVYNANSNQISHTDFNGSTTTFEYDSNQRLTRKVYADASEETYQYDAVGNRIAVTDTQGTTSYDYDNQNRLIREARPDGTALDYSYDTVGNRTRVITTLPTLPAATTETTHYGFDVLNRLQTVTDNASQITTYGYGNVGNRTSVTYPNGNVTRYRYDSLNRLTQVQTRNSANTVISQFDYTLGLTGRRDQIVDLTGATTSYSYDDLYRLLREDITGHFVLGTIANEYQYDPVGNRTDATEQGVSTAYSYDTNDRLLAAGGETYSYDANGNTLTKSIDATVVTNSYDPNNRLIQIIKTESAVEVDNVSYQYDIDGIRNAKNDDGVSTTYVVDKNRDYAQVLNELDSTNKPTVSYVYGDDLIKQTRAANDSYFHYDGLGSTRALSDVTGTITDTYDYSAYGIEIDSTGVTENSYRYTGEQFDANLNQIYLRARYYDPGVGRFTQQDTWAGRQRNPITLNKYVYANANPISNIDPSGRFSISSQMAAISTVGILAVSSQYSYQIGQSLAGGAGSDEGYTSRQIGWIILAAMSGAGSKLYDLISAKVRERNDETVDLARAVGDTELASLYGTQQFNLSPNGFEVKQFFHTQGEAMAFGEIFIKGTMGRSYYHTVEVTISQSLYNILDHDAYEPGIGPIVTVPMGLLPAFNLEMNEFGGFRYTGIY